MGWRSQQCQLHFWMMAIGAVDRSAERGKHPSRSKRPLLAILQDTQDRRQLTSRRGREAVSYVINQPCRSATRYGEVRPTAKEYVGRPEARFSASGQHDQR